MAFNLIKEGDYWINPKEDNTQVIKHLQNEYNNSIEIKYDYLMEYLAARKMGAAIYQFYQRNETLKSFKFSWSKGNQLKEGENYYWQGSQYETDERGLLFGSKTAVFVAKRTDVNYDEDVPDYQPNSNIESSSYEIDNTGDKIMTTNGELFKTDWILHGNCCSRISGEEVESSLLFYTDQKGNQENSTTLTGGIRWLWFKPDIINEILKRSNFILDWYSLNTGSIGFDRTTVVHFGLNELGYINIFTKDIAQLPETYKKIWHSYNIMPDGGVSKELQMAQMECNPASTKAPEINIIDCLDSIQKIVSEQISKSFFKEHEIEKDILKKINRFIGCNKEGIFTLCKELSRIIIERFDLDTLKSIKNENENLGSLKRIERIITELGGNGRIITAPLVGVYELRHVDSHLPSSDISDSLKLLGLQDLDSNNPINTSLEILKKVAQALKEIHNHFLNINKDS